MIKYVRKNNSLNIWVLKLESLSKDKSMKSRRAEIAKKKITNQNTFQYPEKWASKWMKHLKSHVESHRIEISGYHKGKPNITHI